MSSSEFKHREGNANNVSSSSHHGFIAVHVGKNDVNMSSEEFIH